MTLACPVCRSTTLLEIADLGEVPLFCNVQWDTRAEALLAATAPMRLAGCPACGHHFNTAFEADRLVYAPAYDTSQHHSATFRAYAEQLARRLVEAYDLREKTVVDIGCGKGDLLKLVCRLGGNRGFGYDVSYHGDAEPPDAPGVTFRTTFFDAAQSADVAPDFVCCRHVLEHVADPVSFLRQLAASLDGDRRRVLYLEVPNGELQLTSALIWDYIYEHYSYFSPTSLGRALQLAGLEILDLGSAFGDQFLYAEVRLAKPGRPVAELAPAPESVAAMYSAATRFSSLLSRWRAWASALPRDAASTVLWGAGSKGVTFANLLGLTAPIPLDRMIDQNPNKHGRYVARTGQVIAPPASLLERPASTVLLMNDIYRREISRWLDEHGVGAWVASAMSAPPTPGR